VNGVMSRKDGCQLSYIRKKKAKKNMGRHQGWVEAQCAMDKKDSI